jgi:multidrug transporter EmrE-like cation transporter
VWIVLMLVAFLFNGCGVFGLRILAGMGLTETHVNQYLLYFYTGGSVFMGVLLLAKGTWPSRTEVKMGALMALCSLSGTASLAYALGTYKIPGNVAFPISNGGSLFVVVTAGVLLFRERLGVYGILGCVLGTLAIVLLSMS